MGRQVSFSYRGAAVVIMIACMAAAANAIELAPASPAFKDWLGGKAAVDAGADYGYVPSPLDWSHLRSESPKAAPPASFDLRNGGYLTAVRNQSTCGACWAFAACGVMESWLKIGPGEVWDLSENHMKNTHGFSVGPCAGGNNSIAAAYLARWTGPLTEADDPYNPNEVIPPAAGVEAPMHLNSAPVYYADGATNADIKNAIMTLGPVSTPMTYYESSFNVTQNTYYYGGSNQPNHMVAVVGWDDAKVVPGAPSVGAWICKNSWSNGWGENGFFYISYRDTRAVKEVAGFYDLAPAGEDDRVYQYDPLGLTSFAGAPSPVGYAANVFTAANNETLVAVGTHAVANNTLYQISIYTGAGVGANSFTNPVLSFSGVLPNAGYFVIPLPEDVPVTSGQRFAVKIRYQTDGWDYPIPVEAPIAGYAPATASSGQSFLSDNGTYFDDITTLGDDYVNANVCIKAIAGSREVTPPTPSVNISGRPKVELGDSVTLTAVGANLMGTVTYAWFKDDAPLAGAVAPQYVITEADYTHSGSYVVEATDQSKGIYRSDPFVLEVLAVGSLPLSNALVVIALVLLVSGAFTLRRGSCAVRR